MTEEPFFVRESGLFIPQAPCRGPWDPKTLSGRAMVSLLGFQIEQDLHDPDFMPARLTVDMYRLPGFVPLEITTRVVRDGYRIKVIDAELSSGGVSYARASSQWLRRTENSQGNVWSPPDWNVPPPEDVPANPNRMGTQMRPISGAMGQFGQKRMWLEETRPIVGGVGLTPFMRAAGVADLCNPYANSGDKGLGYINSDVTLYLHRLPVDEWVGMEVVRHHATDGVSIGQCVLYDRSGAIGTSSVTGPAQKNSAAQMRMMAQTRAATQTTGK